MTVNDASRVESAQRLPDTYSRLRYHRRRQRSQSLFSAKPPLRTIISWSLAAAPMLAWALTLPGFGDIQYNDYWGIIGQLVDGTEVSANPSDWITIKSNEHTVTIPTLLYFANISLTGGDNRALSAFALCCLAGVAAIIWTLFRRSSVLRPNASDILRPTVAILVFTPAAAHSIVMGFSGTMWFLSNLLAVAAIAVLASRAARRLALWPVIGIGLLGALTYSTNLSLWPALVVGAIVLRVPRRQVLALCVASMVVWTLQLLAYARPAHHPDPTFSNPLAVAVHVCVYLGNPLASDPRIAAACGFSLIAGSLILLYCLHRIGSADWRLAAPWVMLQIFAIGNATGTAVGRSGFGWKQGLASRYISVSVLFAIGVLGLLVLVADRLSKDEDQRLRYHAPVFAALCILVALTTCDRGLPTLDGLLDRASRQPLAEDAIRLGVWGDPSLFALTPAPQEIRAIQGFLETRRHRPFRSYSAVPEPIALPLHEGVPTGIVSHIDAPLRIAGNLIRVSGWVISTERPVSSVHIIDSEGKTAIPMRTNFPDTRAIEQFGRPGRRAGWAGFLKETEEKPPLMKIYVRLDGDAHFYPIGDLPFPADRPHASPPDPSPDATQSPL